MMQCGFANIIRLRRVNFVRHVPLNYEGNYNVLNFLAVPEADNGISIILQGCDPTGGGCSYDLTSVQIRTLTVVYNLILCCRAGVIAALEVISNLA